MALNLPAALDSLASAGVTSAVLVAELGVHRTTVARWAASRTVPSAAHLAALKDLVDTLHWSVLGEQSIADAAQGWALAAAREQLLSEAERARDEELLRRLVTDLEAARVEPWVLDPYAQCLDDVA